MFSIIVASDSAAWETDSIMKMRRDRFCSSYCDNREADAVTQSTPPRFELLNGTRAILLYEDTTSNPTADVIRIGTIHDVGESVRSVSFVFREEGRISRVDAKAFATRLHIDGFEFNHTHWAIKPGNIPTELIRRMKPTPKKYDVVLSFAGEQREYVAQVASLLKEQQVSVFYDEFEKAALWGEDLVEHFDSVYRKDGRFCVMFISKEYEAKMWTRHERRSALARGLEERGVYLLPVRFDDTQIDGLRPTVEYKKAYDTPPADLVQLILERLGRKI